MKTEDEIRERLADLHEDIEEIEEEFRRDRNSSAYARDLHVTHLKIYMIEWVLEGHEGISP